MFILSKTLDRSVIAITLQTKSIATFNALREDRKKTNYILGVGTNPYGPIARSVLGALIIAIYKGDLRFCQDSIGEGKLSSSDPLYNNQGMT